jgi:hypothetical protein
MTDIAAGPGAIPQREFRVGQVLSTAINIYGRHAPMFTFIAGLFWLPAVVVAYYLDGATGDLKQLNAILVFVFALTLQPLSTAIILHAAFQHMRGRQVRLGESVAIGLRRWLTLFGLSFMMTLLVALGIVLLIVPGLILSIMWYVAVPVCVVESKGPSASLNRSQALTKGHRWKLFGLFLLGVILGALGDSVLPQFAGVLGGPAGLLVAQTVWQGFAQAFGSVMVVVAYHDLRVAKEGIDIERIAAVFD